MSDEDEKFLMSLVLNLKCPGLVIKTGDITRSLVILIEAELKRKWKKDNE